MDGFRVMPLVEAAKIGDLFITVTGGLNIIDRQHMLELKDGAILANSGHFNAEINIPALESLSSDKKAVRPFVDQYTLENGKSVFLLGEGRLINLTAAEGHPASVMDMSFANQALCSEYIVKQGREFAPKVYPVPIEVDNTVGWLKLNAMGIGIDTLTPEQKRYQESWEMGT
jgi:adenosylhomocysteinase